MGKSTTITHFFKRKNLNDSEATTSDATLPTTNVDIPIPENIEIPIPENVDIPIQENPHPKFQKIDTSLLERDPGLRQQIWDYHVNQRDEIRRAYRNYGVFQPKLSVKKKSGPEKHRRSFQETWYNLFPKWLEYSPAKDAAFCLPCFLFHKPSGNPGKNAFTVDGFRSWKKVRNGTRCAFLSHVGKDFNSSHRVAEQRMDDLMNQPQHIDKVLNKQCHTEIANNRLQLKVSIDVVRVLALQGIAFRGRDESSTSVNRGNFLEILDVVASYDKKVAEVIAKAPKNATYTSPQIQKEILHVFSMKVMNAIREEIGDAKFCIIVDEARDESVREQMAVVLRFVDKDGFVRERFFGVVHVSDTVALTLKKEIYSLLSRYNLDIQNIRGQGYDGASNMRGESNGLQALISHDCPYAYYIHCFAHRLQLALVAASKAVIPVGKFFDRLAFIINIVGASCKRNEQLKLAQDAEFAYLIDIDELETGRGLNQKCTLQRAGDTRWSSHFRSISSLIKIFSPTCEVLLKIIKEGSTSSRQVEADTAYETLTSFEFVFILHLMKKTMELSDKLCQVLQCQTQDILTAMRLVSSTKELIQTFRDDKWDDLLTNVISFCELRSIDVPDMTARYVDRRGLARHQQDDFTIEHHYRVDIFCAAIDSQLQELNHRFNEHAVELLVLSSALDPYQARQSFRINDICLLVTKFYPQDFTEHEKEVLETELCHFEHNVVRHPEFESLSSISELCQWLVRTRKSIAYQLVFRVVILVLTLPVSTATTERAFSAMNIVKTRLRNKMEDDFLTDSMLLYIEREITQSFSTDSIIDDFSNVKTRRLLFSLKNAL
jgi:hypothetical protein